MLLLAVVQWAWGQALSPRVANYVMDVRLDVDHHQLEVQQTLHFRNPSGDTLHRMPFHLYYNAFKNNQSYFNTEYSRIPREIPKEEAEQGIWGWSELREVRDSMGRRLRFDYANLGNPQDHTVLWVELETPVLPYGEYALEMDWHAQIPKSKARTGYSRDFYFMVQWFPKLGVYEPAGTRFAQKGQWNCHPYYPQTEYYADFGNYRVSLDVPVDYVVGASGVLVDSSSQGGRKTMTYLAEDVIDFAWTAHPGFLRVQDKWREVDVTLLVRPEHLWQKDRFLDAARHTLDFFAEYLEPYPYPSLTIVSPPFHGLYSGAMEYPTLITAPTLSGLPQGIRATETLTIHELTHQYFMQIVATHEQEEPWMDEGFTSYFEAKILDRAYPGGVVDWGYLDVHINSKDLRRGRFLLTQNPKVNPLSDFGFHFQHGSYGDIVYSKACVGLQTLEGLVGEETMKQIIRNYYQRWKYKHPCRDDFLDVVREVLTETQDEARTGQVMAFLEQLIYGTEECDYAVASVSHFPQREKLGFFGNVDTPLYPTNTPDSLEARVLLFRHGEMVVPQEIRVEFENGTEIMEYWNGQARSHELRYRGRGRIVCVELDPDGRIPLDGNGINNSLHLQNDKTGIWRHAVSFLTWMEAALTSVGGLI